MKVIEKGKSEGDAVHLSWDAAQTALASGAATQAPAQGDRVADLPGAQQPAPGTDPVGGEEKAAPGQVLTNMTDVAAPEVVSGGLPKSPAPSQPAPQLNPAPTTPQPVVVVGSTPPSATAKPA